jgi:hypothetical protein
MKTAEYTMQACFEIAAQLAEANEHLAKIANPLITVEGSPWVTFSYKGRKVVIHRDIVRGVRQLPLVPEDDPVPVVEIHSGNTTWWVEGYLVDVCGKLRIPVGE